MNLQMLFCRIKRVYDALNPGQQKQIVKDEAVKELFDRYGVKYE